MPNFPEDWRDSWQKLAMMPFIRWICLWHRTPDRELIRLAEADNRLLVTKDADFVDEHLLRGAPRRLLLMATGNISNADLEGLLVRNLEQIIDLLNESSFLELGRSEVRIHE